MTKTVVMDGVDVTLSVDDVIVYKVEKTAYIAVVLYFDDDLDYPLVVKDLYSPESASLNDSYYLSSTRHKILENFGNEKDYIDVFKNKFPEYFV